MFLESALLGIIVGWFRGGRLRYLSTISLPGLTLALLSLLIQAALWIDFFANQVFGGSYIPYLHIASFFPLLIFIILNWKHKGMAFILAGVLLNLAVISSNEGFMPVGMLKEKSEFQEDAVNVEGSPVHKPLTEDTRLVFLSDIIRVPYDLNRFISIGDIIMSVGILIFLQQGMQKPPRLRRRDWHRIKPVM